jgi:hypothetical protein
MEKCVPVSMKSYLYFIEDRFAIDGLSNGVSGEYANDVAIAFAYGLLMKLRDKGIHNMNDEEVYDLLHDGEQVEQIQQ